MSRLHSRDAADAASKAVSTLRYSGNPEQDHLLDEIQHPETTNALYELATRTAPERTAQRPDGDAAAPPQD
ncbi:hypothetical protein [Kitasatospora sp. KL5]|uniref:hypothetical protein n=1 Tax=Kitasatospora sp. KL5 TaxID=3425125 RepID=UPI003D6DE6D1